MSKADNEADFGAIFSDPKEIEKRLILLNQLYRKNVPLHENERKEDAMHCSVCEGEILPYTDYYEFEDHIICDDCRRVNTYYADPALICCACDEVISNCEYVTLDEKGGEIYICEDCLFHIKTEYLPE